MTLIIKCLRIFLFLILAGFTFPVAAQAADGYLGCWAHQSDKNRVLWTRPFAANQADKQATSADFLTFLKARSYVQDLSVVSGTCVWKSDAASVTQEINGRKTAFRNATDLGVNYQGKVAQAAAAAPSTALKDDCDKGNAIACRDMAIVYAEGRGVPVDHAAARRFYEKACNGGESLSCYNLGVAHGTGTGGPADATQAVAFYKKACDLKFPNGCTNLGWHYDTGTGVVMDKVKALALYRQACDLGQALGCTNRDILQKSLAATPADFDKTVASIVASLDRSIKYEAGADAAFARGDADGAMSGYYSAMIILPDLVLTPVRDLVAKNLAATEKPPGRAERLTALVNQSVALSQALRSKIKKTCLAWPDNFKRLPYDSVCDSMK